jgi:hypothetical protein
MTDKISIYPKLRQDNTRNRNSENDSRLGSAFGDVQTSLAPSTHLVSESQESPPMAQQLLIAIVSVVAFHM